MACFICTRSGIKSCNNECPFDHEYPCRDCQRSGHSERVTDDNREDGDDSE